MECQLLLLAVKFPGFDAGKGTQAEASGLSELGWFQIQGLLEKGMLYTEKFIKIFKGYF